MRRIFNFLLLMCISITFAQAQKNDETKVLEVQLKSFAKDYSDITKTKDVNKVLGYMSPKLTSTIVYTSIRDRISYSESDYDGFAAHLRQLISTPAMKVNYKIKKILSSQISGNSGIVTYLVNFENMRNGEIWAKGNETVSMMFRKTKNKWLMVHYTVIGIEDEKFKGACLCELFASSDNIAAKTTIPQGDRYTTEVKTFNFAEKDNSVTSIMFENDVYAWTSNGEVWLLDSGGGTVEKVGMANKKPEAVVQIIKYKYKKNCTNFRVKM